MISGILVRVHRACIRILPEWNVKLSVTNDVLANSIIRILPEWNVKIVKPVNVH